MVAPSPQPRSAPSAADYRELLRLAGEAMELPADSRERRGHVAERLAELVGCVGACLLQLDPSLPTALPAALTRDGRYECFGGMRGQETFCVSYLRDNLYETDPVPQAMSRLGRTVAQASGFVDDATWYNSAQHEHIRRPAGLDNQIYAPVLLHGAMTGLGLGLVRARGDRPFSGRDLALVEQFNALCPLAWDLVLRETADAPALPPRYVPVFDALLAGEQAKQTARRLGLSLATVYEYTKQIYRRLGVGSRGELLARFIRR